MTQTIKTALLSAPMEWQGRAAKQLEHFGWHTSGAGPQLAAWQPVGLKSVAQRLQFVEGIVIGRVWLGGPYGNGAIRIEPRRFYFYQGEDSKPLREREFDLLSGHPVPRPNKGAILEQVRLGLHALASADGFSVIRADETVAADNVLSRTTAIGDAKQLVPLAQDMWRGVAQTGVFRAPATLNLYVVNDPGRPGGGRQAEEYIRFLEQKWRDVTSADGQLMVKRISLDRLLERLEIKQAASPLNDTVFLLAVSGERGQPLPEPQARVMDLLDQVGQPYRLFSYDNDNLRYSASNQILSVIQAVGGVPYRLQLPFPEPFDDGVLLGIDLGHDRDRRRSAAVASVLGPDGVLLGAVKHFLPLNEALSGKLVARLLNGALEEAEKRLGRKVTRALVFRDGRVPARRPRSDQESVEDYVTALGVPTAFVEVRKGGNPPLWVDAGQRIIPAPAGSMLAPLNAEVRFVTCYESIEQSGPPRTFKVTLPKAGDAFGWGLDVYTGIVCGLCYSPSLGVKPHLPGPIYWADGIAKTSDHDNRFRGQHVRIIA
jgi:hypothetical protein